MKPNPQRLRITEEITQFNDCGYGHWKWACKDCGATTDSCFSMALAAIRDLEDHKETHHSAN